MGWGDGWPPPVKGESLNPTTAVPVNVPPTPEWAEVGQQAANAFRRDQAVLSSETLCKLLMNAVSGNSKSIHGHGKADQETYRLSLCSPARLAVAIGSRWWLASACLRGDDRC